MRALRLFQAALTRLLGNSVEHITAVTVSVKDKLNLSMSIAVGSSIQVSLALLPVLVLIGWAIGQPMMLFFDQFETCVSGVDVAAELTFPIQHHHRHLCPPRQLCNL